MDSLQGISFFIDFVRIILVNHDWSDPGPASLDPGQVQGQIRTSSAQVFSHFRSELHTHNPDLVYRPPDQSGVSTRPRRAIPVPLSVLRSPALT